MAVFEIEKILDATNEIANQMALYSNADALVLLVEKVVHKMTEIA